MSDMEISAVIVGERTRKDMGDIEGLARSMQEHGLLHPVVVLNDGTLVAGGRRLAAAGLLGWQRVPVTVVNVADLLAAERDENTLRKSLTPTEAVELGRLVEAAHKAKLAAALPAQLKRAGMIRAHGENFPAGESLALGRTDEVVAAAVGMSPPTYRRAKRVVEAAESDPETFGDLPGKMDETGKVAEALREVSRRKDGNGRSPVHYKAQYPKPNREMERGLIALDGLVTGFGLIELDGLDRSKTAEWAKALNRAASSLQRIARKVRTLHG